MRGIYKIINQKTKDYYVGSSSEIPRRWRRHVEMLDGNRHVNKKLQNAWNKYGKDCFEFFVVEQLTEAQSLIEVEQRYLDVASSEQSKTYNLKFKANGWDWKNNRETLIASLPHGAYHKDYDSTIYEFVNESGETFKGTRCDFYTKYGLRTVKHHIRALITGKRKTVKGWSLKSV
jgi:hypothetical protein